MSVTKRAPQWCLTKALAQNPKIQHAEKQMLQSTIAASGAQAYVDSLVRAKQRNQRYTMPKLAGMLRVVTIRKGDPKVEVKTKTELF